MNVMPRSISSTVLWFHLLQKWLLLTAVEGSGHMALKLMEYKHNTPGKLLSGDCCDGVSGSNCSGSVCDPYFVIRITETNQRTQTVNIQYQTDTLKDVEIITFTDRIGSAPNPVNNSFNVWPGMVEIHITIMDNNTDSGVPDQVIANFTADFSRAHDPLLQNATEFSPLVFIDDPRMTGVSMKATFNIRCDVHYTYDQFCYKFCQPMENATGHLSCDASGTPSCLPGWTGDPKRGCLQASCSPNPCQNGGRCVSGQGNTLCACAAGFSGLINKVNNDSSSSINLGPIIGGVVGGLAALALLGLLLFLFLRRRKREKKVRPTEEYNVEEMTTEENGDTPKADNSVSA